MLTLFEEFFLLAVHEEKGAVISTTARRLHYGLGGAILAELAFEEKVKVGDGRRLELTNDGKTGDIILDSAIEKIQREGQRKVTYWVKSLNENPKKLRKRLMERLVQKGILAEEDSSYTWLIPSSIVPEVNASAKYALKRRLRDITMACVEPEIKELALLTLLRSSSLLNLCFMKDERKLARQRIYELMIGKALSNPIAAWVEEICGAVESVVGAD